MEGFIIRQATIDDVPNILRLITALAEFEKMAEQNLMTEDQLRHDGFGETPFFTAEVVEATDTNDIVAMAIWFTYGPRA